MWMSAGFFDEAGELRIDGVTGPDEYSAVADNNVYTNLMAARNLSVAADAVEAHPGRAETLGVDPAEPLAWRRAASAMRVPWDEELGVHPQSDGFTLHERWDFDSTGADEYPLMLHHPYLQLYRKQVVKQADLVLAMLTCGDRFSRVRLSWSDVVRPTTRDFVVGRTVDAPSGVAQSPPRRPFQEDGLLRKAMPPGGPMPSAAAPHG
jgi:trehalose/maltose hydrolase-like predicted phosphorylase